MATSFNSSRASSNLEKEYLKEDELFTVITDFDDLKVGKKDAVFGVLEDDSPYPEVRSAVANTDDPTIPVSTLRVWVLGLTLTILLAGLDQFFFFRYPSITITTYVAVLVSLPLGRAWAAVVPKWRIFGVPLNPGPFSIKEHVLLTIMSSVASEWAYATDIIAVQRVYYNQVYSFSYQWMLVMSTQLLGFSMGGLLQRFLVKFPSMSAHPVSRAPENVVVNQLFGSVSGLGMSLITFDWTQISLIGSPLATPWWAEANIAAGFIFIIWILTPILYYTNTWYSAYLPISSRISFDNTGSSYNVTRIINSDMSFNLTAYKQYSPLFLSTTFAICYGLSFASTVATLVHALLYFRQQIWAQSRRSLHDHPDVHTRLMSRYKQVPAWWYGAIFAALACCNESSDIQFNVCSAVSTFVFGIILNEVWHTQFPLWAFCVCLAIPLVYAIPIGMIQAITNQQPSLNVVAELIAGYALPGRPVAVMLFKTWGYVPMSQALLMSSDFKLGHYMKIPPRPMFWAQVVATVVAGTVQLGVQAWMFTNIPDICSPDQKNGFICPHTEVFGTASIIWSVIGPQRMFSPGSIYHPLLYGFIIGAVCPVITYMIQLKWPKSFVRYINFPVILTGSQEIPPATAVNYVPWAIVGFIFNYYVRRRYYSWWIKYNYVLSAALDSGVAISVVLVFFFLQYPKDGTIGLNTVQVWLANTVFSNTADGKGLPYKPMPDSGKFGPTAW